MASSSSPEDLAKEIEETKKKIEETVKAIEDASTKFFAARESDSVLAKYWEVKEQHLHRKEQNLHRKEHQLREELLVLRKAKTAVAEFARQRGKDLTKAIARAHGVLALPTLDKLIDFIETKQNGLVFPIDEVTYEALQSEDQLNLFQKAEGPDYCITLCTYLQKILKPPSTGHTELSWIHFWDTLVFDFVELFCICGVRKDRTTSSDTFTRTKLPDMVAYLGPFALFRGEEKAEGVTLVLPRNELIEKLEWTYEGLPYILAYYASGPALVLTALYYDRSHGVCSLELMTFNLRDLGDRVRLVNALFNVASLLPRLQELCVQYNAESDLVVYENQVNGKRVEVFGKLVTKVYRDQSTCSKVCQIYNNIRGCANAEQLIRQKRASDSTKLTFTPRCMTKKRARPLPVLVLALKDVATCLRHLYQLGYMHRDVHWRNVGYDPATGHWCLFDFDEAARWPCKKPVKLCLNAHAKEALAGAHDYKVDIWGLGHLVLTSRVDVSECPELLQLRDRCLQEDPRLRPELGEVISLLDAIKP